MGHTRYYRHLKAGAFLSGHDTPVNTVAPVITGSDAGATLSVSDGTWTSADTFTYSWQKDGVPIAGEVANTLVTDPTWVGSTITATVQGGEGGPAVDAQASGVVLSFAGPIDTIPGPVVAYSTRALSAAMRGQNIFRLRRSSDDAELDFAADATTGEPPLAAITSWLAGATAYVVTMYDQSGNGEDATQAVAAQQPQFVMSGGPNDRPYLDFVTASSTSLVSATNASFPAGNYGLFFVGKKTSDDNILLFHVGPGDTVEYIEAFFVGAGAGQYGYDAEDALNTDVAYRVFATDPASASFFQIDSTFANGSGDGILNGVSLTLADNFDSGGALNAIANPVWIGSSAVGPMYSNENFCELIVYNVTLTDPGRSTVRQNEANYFGITLP